MNKLTFIVTLILSICSITSVCNAQRSFLKPIFGFYEQYDDNIYLTQTAQTDDFITGILAGIEFAPRLKRHSFNTKYMVDFEMFAENSGENNIGQTFEASGELNFNKWQILAGNALRFGEDRSGSEDTSRNPMTTDRNDIKLIRNFNKLKVGLEYLYNYENYRSDNPIGSYAGEDLTYEDLDTDENSGELEFDFRFLPKTSALFSTRVGVLTYDTGKKSDSHYFDVLTGLRGQLFNKGQIEGKAGYRTQNFEDTSDDFNHFIFNVSFMEKFTTRDAVTISFERSSYPTVYQENPYYEGTNVTGAYTHELTKRISGKLSGAYWFNKYPVETTEGTKTARREDHLWEAGTGLIYKLPKYGSVNLDYIFSSKISNFRNFEYKNNKYTVGMKLEF